MESLINLGTIWLWVQIIVAVLGGILVMGIIIFIVIAAIKGWLRQW